MRSWVSNPGAGTVPYNFTVGVHMDKDHFILKEKNMDPVHGLDSFQPGEILWTYLKEQSICLCKLLSNIQSRLLTDSSLIKWNETLHTKFKATAINKVGKRVNHIQTDHLHLLWERTHTSPKISFFSIWAQVSHGSSLPFSTSQLGIYFFSFGSRVTRSEYLVVCGIRKP